MNNSTARGKGFRRWIATATTKRASTLQYAVVTLVPQLESAGFQWVDRSFDCGIGPPHTINLEREIVPGHVDYIQFNFDKRHRARFQVLFGTKEAKPPHRWIRSGALVWKKKSDSIDYKWWGARWWHVDREAALTQTINTVSALLPQLLQFLSEGAPGKNIWAVTPTGTRAQ